MTAIIHSRCHKLTTHTFYYQRGYKWAPKILIDLWSKRQRNHLAGCNKCQQIVVLLEYYRNLKDRLGEEAMETCPVCKQTNLDDYDICEVCGWEEDPLARLRPTLCEGGPNFLPLSMARSHWKEGIRDKIRLGKCPRNEECLGCTYDAYPVRGVIRK